MIVASTYAPRRDHPMWQDYRPYLALQRRSVERYGHRQVVITDAAGALEMPDFDCFVDTTMPHELMPALVHAQADFLGADGYDDDVAFIGADGLLGHDPAALMDGHFAIGVTVDAGFMDCHLNTGLMLVAAGARSEAAAVWALAAKHCGDNWSDDQRSLAGALDVPIEHGLYRRHYGNLLVMPAFMHNDAPTGVEDGRRPVIVHFRGLRKAYMAEWAARHMDLVA